MDKYYSDESDLEDAIKDLCKADEMPGEIPAYFYFFEIDYNGDSDREYTDPVLEQLEEEFGDGTDWDCLETIRLRTLSSVLAGISTKT